MNEMLWSDALKISISLNAGYDYDARNISDEGIEIITQNETIIYISPGDYVSITKEDLVATLSVPAYNGICTNAKFKNGLLYISNP